MNDSNHSRNLATRSRAGSYVALFLLAGLPAVRVTQAADLGASNNPSAVRGTKSVPLNSAVKVQ